MSLVNVGNVSGDSFHEHQIDGSHKTHKSQEMVPMQCLTLKKQVGNDGEDNQGDAFLYHLELYERERPAVARETYAVGRHLAAVFEESDAPRENDYSEKRPV